MFWLNFSFNVIVTWSHPRYKEQHESNEESGLSFFRYATTFFFSCLPGQEKRRKSMKSLMLKRYTFKYTSL